MNCVVCGETLDPALAPEVSHPSCSGQSFLGEAGAADPFNDMLKQKLIEMILYAERNSARSLQPEIGASEIGGACDRRIAYRMAAIPAVNRGFDPWPAIVGTAVHSWLEVAVQKYQREHSVNDWMTETTLLLGEFAKSHSDLYWRPQRTVIDWKTGGPTTMKKLDKEGAPDGYWIQAQCYGLGFEQLGHVVERVSLVFLPRAGWLSGMKVLSQPFDRELAQAALDRAYGLAETALNLDVFRQPHRWERIPATPGDECGSCPWFNALGFIEQGASDKGCPGI